MTSKNISEAVFKNISVAESTGRWTDGSPAVVKLNKALPKNCKITLHIETTFVSNVGQIFSVNIGNSVQNFSTPMAKSLVKFYFKDIPDNTYEISINIPNPTSPKDLKLSDDPRRLGIVLSKIEISNY
jgi:phosphoglycerol transferase